MRSVPNFAPRGSGAIILCKSDYTAKDCDCVYCPHSVSRGRKIGCSLDRCDCIQERIAAGAASYREILSETLSAVRHPPFILRLNQYLKESEDHPMDYQSLRHRETFIAAIRPLNRKDHALIAALYLLTAESRLWAAAKKAVRPNGIHLIAVSMPNCSEDVYTLLGAAKDLYLGTKHLTVGDLADGNLISPKMFALICNAMAIRRFGLGAIHFTLRSKICESEEKNMNEWERLHRQAEHYKAAYPPGTRILLLHIGEDPRPVEAGTRGTVIVVDDIGTLHCKFDNGRSLGIVPGEDSFRKLTAEELSEEHGEGMTEEDRGPVMQM